MGLNPANIPQVPAMLPLLPGMSPVCWFIVYVGGAYGIIRSRQIKSIKTTSDYAQDCAKMLTISSTHCPSLSQATAQLAAACFLGLFNINEGKGSIPCSKNPVINQFAVPPPKVFTKIVVGLLGQLTLILLL